MKIKTLLLLLTCFIGVNSIAQEQINIHKSDNSTLEFNTSDIKDFTFGNNSQSLFINKVDEANTELLVSEIDSITFSETKYIPTYSKNNEILDVMDGYWNIDLILIDSKFTFSDIILPTGVHIEKTTHPLFQRGYKLKSDTPLPSLSQRGVRLLQMNMPQDVVGSSVKTLVWGFWINRKEIETETLIINSFNGGLLYLNPTDLATKGFSATQVEGVKQVEILEVNGDYSYVLVRSISQKQEDWFFNIVFMENKSGFKELTLYNPTMLYDSDIIDPYHIYKSESQRNNSSIRGKKLLVHGDSQQNDGEISKGLVRKLGVNITHIAMGGNRISYGAVPAWMYNWNARKQILESEVDYYVLMISSNDAVMPDLGGSLNTDSIQAVYDNYPKFGDDEATINNKLNIFNNLTEQQRLSTYRYKQTYAAYIEQIKAINPNAKIILVTIPVSSYDVTEEDEYGNTVYKTGVTADAMRTERDHLFTTIRSFIYEIAAKYNLPVCDLYNNGGITWENLPTKVRGTDSVHWTAKAKSEFVAPLVEVILENVK